MRSHSARMARPGDALDDIDDDLADEFDRQDSGDDDADETAGTLGGSLRPGTGAFAADAERLLAATVALMTSFYRCPHTALCRKLLDNLAMLSKHPDLSEPLRMVCRNAEARWASYLEEVEQAIAEVGELDCDADDDEDTPTTLH
jgi:hypothetical protein